MTAPATAMTIYERVEQSAVVAALDSQSEQLMPFLGDEDAVARFRRGVVVAIAKNPDLMNCTPQSIILACFEAAQQGLEPTGAAGGAHLVPYKMKDGTRVAQLIPDYRGVIRMVTKPGSEVLSLEARVVKEGDDFAYQLGTDAFVQHVPALDPARSAKATTHVYAIARLRNGATIPDVEDRAGIERIRKRGANSSQSPWVTDWDEMGKKTLIKRLSKVLPVRPDVRQILTREDELGEGDDASAAATLPASPTKVASLASRIQPRNVTPASDAPGAAEDTGQLPESTPSDDAAAAPPGAATDDGDGLVEGLTNKEFMARAQALGISGAECVAAAKARWPEYDPVLGGGLTPAQRLELIEALEQAAAL